MNGRDADGMRKGRRAEGKPRLHRLFPPDRRAPNGDRRDPRQKRGEGRGPSPSGADQGCSEGTAENPLRRSHGPELPTPTLLPICRRLPFRRDRQQGGRGEDHGRYTALTRCSAQPSRVTGENGGSRCVEGIAVPWQSGKTAVRERGG